jgi:hypothetical protein
LAAVFGLGGGQPGGDDVTGIFNAQKIRVELPGFFNVVDQNGNLRYHIGAQDVFFHHMHSLFSIFTMITRCFN